LKKILILFLLIACGFSAYGSELRLMGMGELQGIIDDDTDYLYDITALPTVKSSQISVWQMTNSFSNYFPMNNAPSTYILELRREGSNNNNSINGIFKFGRQFAVAVHSDLKLRDFFATYLDSLGVQQTLKRKGSSNTKFAGFGYSPVYWFTFGAGYEEQLMDDVYTGSETTRPDGADGINCEETGHARSVFYGLRFGYPAMYVSFGAGGGSSLLETEDRTQGIIGQVRGRGLERASMMFGSKFFSGRVGIKYGYFSKMTPTGNEGKSLLGIEIRPGRNLTMGFGSCYEIYDDFYTSTFNVGLEYSLTSDFKFRCGMVDKVIRYSWGIIDLKDSQNLQDYTLGFEYKITGSLVLEGAYKDYADVYGGYNNWCAASWYQQSTDYYYTPTRDRNYVYMFGLNYYF
jgi:hypothetical protein